MRARACARFHAQTRALDHESLCGAHPSNAAHADAVYAGQYILLMSVAAASSASAFAGSTVCLHLTAHIMTLWCAFNASTYSSSFLKGHFGSPIGLTRWQRQYSDPM